MKDEVTHLSLEFYDLDPEEITNKLEITPTRIAIKGEKKVDEFERKYTEPTDWWSFENRVVFEDVIFPHSLDLEEEFSSNSLVKLFLDEVILPKKEIVKELGFVCNAGISFYQETPRVTSYFFLKKEILKILAELNLSIVSEIKILK